MQTEDRGVMEGACDKSQKSGKSTVGLINFLLCFYCGGFKFHRHLINAGRKGCHFLGYLRQNDDLVNCSEIGGAWDKTEA